MSVLVGIGLGIAAAAVRAGLGWFKSGTPWEGWKTGRTIIIAVVEGGLIGGFLDLGARETFAAVFLGTVTVEDAMLGIWRRATG